MSSVDDDWLAVERNLQRVREKLGRIILGRKEADKRTAGRFYVAVVQTGFPVGSKTWVLTPWLEKAIKEFRHQAAQQMAGMGPKRQRYGAWVYPPIGAALEMV